MKKRQSIQIFLIHIIILLVFSTSLLSDNKYDYFRTYSYQTQNYYHELTIVTLDTNQFNLKLYFRYTIKNTLDSCIFNYDGIANSTIPDLETGYDGEEVVDNFYCTIDYDYYRNNSEYYLTIEKEVCQYDRVRITVLNKITFQVKCQLNLN